MALKIFLLKKGPFFCLNFAIEFMPIITEQGGQKINFVTLTNDLI